MADRISGFAPDDRLWWIVRVRIAPLTASGTGSPSVRVTLSALDESATLSEAPLYYEEASCELRSSIRVLCLAGLIPKLTIGTVFKNEKAIGRLKSKIRKFKFDRSSTVTSASSAPPPEFRDRDVIASLCNYLHGGAGSDNWLFLQDREQTLIIPGFEVFRTFYGRNSELALALLSGRWDNMKTRVVDPALTRADEHGAWFIRLRTRMETSLARLLAHLTISPFGLASANRVFTQFLAAENSPPGVRKPGLSLEIPFGWDSLELTCRTTPLNVQKVFLGYEITAVNPPLSYFQASLEMTRDIDKNPGPRISSSKIRNIKSKNRVAQEDPEGNVNVNSDEDPGKNSEVKEFEATGAIWPKDRNVTRGRKLWKRTKFDKVSRSPPEKVPEASPGNLGPWNSDLATANYTQKVMISPPAVFSQLIVALIDLKQSGRISDWRLLNSSQDGMIEFTGDVRAWPIAKLLPIGRNWSKTASGRLRTALVCEIKISNHVMVLVEIERRSTGESFRLALAPLPEGPVDQFVRPLLNLAVKTKGSWSSIGDKAKISTGLQGHQKEDLCQGAVPATSLNGIVFKNWKHQYLRKDTATDTVIDYKILARFLANSTELA